jgi:hypothetical protein
LFGLFQVNELELIVKVEIFHYFLSAFISTANNFFHILLFKEWSPSGFGLFFIFISPETVEMRNQGFFLGNNFCSDDLSFTFFFPNFKNDISDFVEDILVEKFHQLCEQFHQFG